MTMDVDTGPPQSVEIQQEIEQRIDVLREVIEPGHIWAGIILAVVGYLIVTGDGTEAASSTGAALEDVTVAEIAKGAAIVIGAGFALTVNISIHELCHQVAFRYFGIPASWSLSWISVRGYSIYPFAVGGLCEPRSIPEYARLSWTEDVVVSLAPLAWSAVLLAGLGAFHILVDPVPSLKFVAAMVFLLSGPSPPDYASLLGTPRDRWETFVGLEERLDQHATAEGIRT